MKSNHKSARLFGIVLVLITLSSLVEFPGCSEIRLSASAMSDTTARRAKELQPLSSGLSKTTGKLPLCFVENQGQAHKSVRFVSQLDGYSLFLNPAEVVLDGGDVDAQLRMKLAGGNQQAKTIGIEKLPGKFNYFVGNNSKEWHENVP